MTNHFTSGLNGPRVKCNKTFFYVKDLAVNALTPSPNPLAHPEKSQKQYFRQGYLYIPNFIPSPLVWRLRRQYFSRWAKFEDRDLDYGVRGHPAYDFVRTLEFQEFSERTELNRMADLLLSGKSQLLKRRILRHFHKGVEKSSRAHADLAYWDQNPSDIITLWIPIGNCMIEMGGILYLEGSHRLDYKKIKREFFRDERHPWISDDLNKISSITGRHWLGQNFSAGDIVAHHPRIIHASLNCETHGPRLSMDLRFIKKGAPSDPRWMDFWRADDGY